MSSFLQRHKASLAAATAAIIALILYWPSLNLPVIYDSLLHIRISDDLTLTNVWQPTEKFGFYRPLTFLPLILVRQLFGAYPNWLLHGMNVAQHSFNAFLLALLVWRLWRNWRRALAVGLLFALFPFSYQAVVVYGHNVHPAIAGLILLALHTYLNAINTAKTTPSNSSFIIHHSSFFWWSATAILFILALLSHESAILFGAFAALIHWNREPHSSFTIQRPSFQIKPWMIFLALGGLYIVVYQFLPIGAGPQGDDGGGSLWLRALYLLQEAAYPLTWFAHLLPNVSAQVIILTAVALTLGLTLWTAVRRRAWLPLLLGWGWWGLASALIAIPLPTSYMLRGPRLLYLGSVGVALAWGVMLTGNSQQKTVNERTTSISTLQSLIATLLLAAILLLNWQFVREKLADYAELTGPVAVVDEVMAERPSSEGVILVNLPQWLAPPRNTYAIGGEYVAMLGQHLFADELIGVNVNAHSTYPIVALDLLQDPAYQYGLHKEADVRDDISLPIASDWAAAGSQLFIVRYPDEGIQTDHTGGFRPATGTAARASLGPYELLAANGLSCDGVVQVNLVWRQAEPVQPTASVFVQLLGEDGRLIAQADGPPLGLRPDLLQLAPGWEITDQRTLELTEPGTLTQLLIGIYDFASGERAPALDSRQNALPDNAYRIPLASCP